MLDQRVIVFIGAILVFCHCPYFAVSAENETESSSINATVQPSTNSENQTETQIETMNLTTMSATTTPLPPSVGDANYCKGNHSVLLVPGYGWDNLLNKKMAQIFKVNYSLCIRTEDGAYLVPDNMTVSALSPVREELRAVLFQHWNTYVSMAADSLNKEGDNLFNTPGLSGSFTSAYQRVKESLVKDKAVTSRVELRYPFYTIGLSLKSMIGEEFNQDINHVAHLLTSRSLKEACYFTELLITKYGTHYINRVDLGAAISQEDSLLRSLLNVSTLQMQTDVEATAIAFFLKGVGMSLYKPTSLSQNTPESEQYLKARLTKLNLSVGGIFPANETSVSGWLKSISNNLAVIQEEGNPLYELITSENFPHMEASVKDVLRQKLQSAIKEYYELNYHKGCTRVDSPNFSYQALKDDGSCQLIRKPFVFGGVYQTCEMVRSEAGDLCGNMSVKNEFNDKLACDPGFQTVLLYSRNKTTEKSGKNCEEKCTGLWVFRTCENVCTETPSYSRATYNVFWCVAQANGSNETTSPGLQFGGVFNNLRSNPITNGKTCPTNFKPVKLYEDVTVCVSTTDPLSHDSADSVVFGGFYTCSEGNPLAENTKQHNPSPDGDVVQVQLDSEGASGGIAVTQGSPQTCPTGYATQKIPTSDMCNIYYCIHNIVSNKNFNPPALIAPPFCSFDPNKVGTVGAPLQFPETTKSSEVVEEESESGLPSDAVAGIVMAIFLLVIVVGIGVMIYVKKKKERDATMFHDDYKELID